MNNLDQTKLQMLVDGGLDHQQRSDLLRPLESNSAAWREIAIAFLEKQVIDEALAHDQIAKTMTSPSKRLDPTTHKGTNRSGIFWLALAASLLLGLWLGSLLPTEIPPTELADNSQPSQFGKVVADESLQLADALARSIRPVSLDTRREFLRAGYVVNESHELADVTLPTGDLIQMPVRQFEIKYLGNAAFQ